MGFLCLFCVRVFCFLLVCCCLFGFFYGSLFARCCRRRALAASRALLLNMQNEPRRAPSEKAPRGGAALQNGPVPPSRVGVSGTHAASALVARLCPAARDPAPCPGVRGGAGPAGGAGPPVWPGRAQGKMPKAALPGPRGGARRPVLR